jgi:formylglycine-generating enzyme required for sulfatase activity
MNDFNNLIAMAEIPGGSYLMGSPEGVDCDDELPQHIVNVPSFFMGKYLVTQDQYEAVMGENPSYFNGSNLPVEQVSWNDAVEFCERLSQLTGDNYRLPTEAEWEYACRASTTTFYYFGEELTRDQANFDSYRTSAAGIYPPNAFGLYDMHGNVWEWCQDVWHDNYDGAPTDGSAWIDDGDDRYRIIRGGSWRNNPVACRAPLRFYRSPGDRYSFLGFRVVCSVVPGLF